MQIPEHHRPRSLPIARFFALAAVAGVAVVAAPLARRQPAHAQLPPPQWTPFQKTLSFAIPANVEFSAKSFNIPIGTRLHIQRISTEGYEADGDLTTFSLETGVDQVLCHHELQPPAERNLPGQRKLFVLCDTGGGIVAEPLTANLFVHRFKPTSGAQLKFDVVVSGELEPVPGG